MAVNYTWPTGLPGPDSDTYRWSEQPRVREAKFGDGYAQRIVDGLNPTPRSFQLNWPNLSSTDKDTIRNFLLARAGSDAFYWTPPSESTQLKVKAPKWDISTKAGVWWSVAATFEQVYDQ